MIKIKNKTALRKRILDNYCGTRTTDEYTNVVIYDDGTVEYYNQNETCSDRLKFRINQTYSSLDETRVESSLIITKWFNQIELLLNDKIEMDEDCSIIDLM